MSSTQCGVRCFYPWLLSTEEKVFGMKTHKCPKSCPVGKDLPFLFGNAMILESPDIDIRPLAKIDQVVKGIEPPSDLVSACNLLGEVKTFQDDCLQVCCAYFHSFTIMGKFL